MNRNQRRMAEYNARKAAQQIDAGNYAGKINRAFAKLSGASLPRVEQALRAPNWREPKETAFVTLECQEYRKVRNPLGQQVNARQKMRGKSIPLI